MDARGTFLVHKYFSIKASSLKCNLIFLKYSNNFTVDIGSDYNEANRVITSLRYTCSTLFKLCEMFFLCVTRPQFS